MATNVRVMNRAPTVEVVVTSSLPTYIFWSTTLSVYRFGVSPHVLIRALKSPDLNHCTSFVCVHLSYVAPVMSLYIPSCFTRGIVANTGNPRLSFLIGDSNAPSKSTVTALGTNAYLCLDSPVKKYNVTSAVSLLLALIPPFPESLTYPSPSLKVPFSTFDLASCSIGYVASTCGVNKLGNGGYGIESTTATIEATARTERILFLCLSTFLNHSLIECSLLGFKQYIDNAETYVIWLEGRKFERRMMRGRR